MAFGIKNSSENTIQPSIGPVPVKNTGNSKTSWQTRFKQAACLGLLSSPLAAGAQPALPGAGSNARRLLDSLNPCDTNTVIGPYAGYVGDQQLPVANTTLAVLGDSLWSQVWCNNGKAQPSFLNTSSIGLTYTFGPSIPSNASGQLSGAAQDAVTNTMRQLPLTVGLQAWHIDYETGDLPDIPSFAFGTSNAAGRHDPWEGTGLTQGLNDELGKCHVYVLAHDQANADASWRLSTLAQGLGLKARTSPGFGGVAHDIGSFPKDTMSSVTFNNVSSCANVTRFGALDLGALVDFYGFSKSVGTNYNLTLDDTYGVGGMIVPPTGNNTLIAQTQSWRAVQIYMPDDGAYDTFVGYTRARLAPGSLITNADISGTYGGIIVGNGYPNQMVGSVNNDSFIVWGPTNVTTNGGYDLVYLNAKNTSANIKDFNKNSTLWFNDFGHAPSVASWGTNGTSVTNADGSVAYLHNISPKDVKPLVNLVSTSELSANVSAPTNLAECITELKLLNITSNPPAAPGHTGGFDPCEHVGEPGINPCACPGVCG